MDDPGNHDGMDVCDRCGDWHPTEKLVDLDHDRYCTDCASEYDDDEVSQHVLQPYLDPALFPGLVLDEAGVPVKQARVERPPSPAERELRLRDLSTPALRELRLLHANRERPCWLTDDRADVFEELRILGLARENGNRWFGGEPEIEVTDAGRRVLVELRDL